MFIDPKRGRQENGRGQAKGLNQFRVQESGRQARGQGRPNGQAGGYRVQKRARVKTGRTRKKRITKAGVRGKTLVDLEHTR